MNRIVSSISLALAVVSFAYIFTKNIPLCCIYGIISIILLEIGYKIEAWLKSTGNDFFNRIIYYLTPNDKKYNLLSKQLTYSYLGNDTYAYKKEYEIYPFCNLDRMNDRFAWSAPSADASLSPIISSHEINDRAQKDLFTNFTVYFNEICQNHKSYKTGALIENLIDSSKTALPYVSARITRKTKLLNIIIKIPKGMNPKNAKFKVYSLKNDDDEIMSVDLDYDSSVGGYSKTVNYPRKGWRYVLSWDF